MLALAVTLAMLLAMVGPPGAGAQGKAAPNKAEQANCATGSTVPASKISIQLWISTATSNAVSCYRRAWGHGNPCRAAGVCPHLPERGRYRNIEPYSFHGLTVEQFGDRIGLLHIKDVADIGLPTQRRTTVGQGDVHWAAVFAAAQGKVRQYVIEQDPPVEPFSFAAESFEYVDCLVF